MADDTEVNWFAFAGNCLGSTVQNCWENRLLSLLFLDFVKKLGWYCI